MRAFKSSPWVHLCWLLFAVGLFIVATITGTLVGQIAAAVSIVFKVIGWELDRWIDRNTH